MSKIALITIFNPSKSVFDNIISIGHEVDKVFMIDNSPCRNDFISKLELIDSYHYHYSFEGKNHGLSKAFNNILNNNSFDEGDYLFFYDQDTRITYGHIERMVNEYERLKDSGFNVGCIGPAFVNNTNEKILYRSKKRKIGRYSYAVNDIITSSLMCEYKNIRDIGFWNEDYFLDLADMELCNRFWMNGFICVQTYVSSVCHELGEGEKRIAFLKFGVEKPIREYYQLKSAMHMLVTKGITASCKADCLWIICFRFFFHFVLMPERLVRLKCYFWALVDNLFGRYGEFSDIHGYAL